MYMSGTGTRPQKETNMAKQISERDLLTKFIEHMAKEGWQPFEVRTDDSSRKVNTTDELLDEVFSLTGESWIRFDRNGIKAGVMVVPGNGRDLIADWSAGRPVVDASVEPFLDTIETLYA